MAVAVDAVKIGAAVACRTTRIAVPCGMLTFVAGAVIARASNLPIYTGTLGTGIFTLPRGALLIFHSVRQTSSADWTALMGISDGVGTPNRFTLLFMAHYIPGLTPALQAGSAPGRVECFSISVDSPVILTFIARGAALSFTLGRVTALWCGT